MKNYIFFFILTLCGCAQNTKNGDSDFDLSSFAQQKELKGVELQLGELSLPKRIKVAGDKLLLVNFMTPKFISVYDLKTGSYAGDLLSAGRAGNEVLAVDNIYVDRGKGIFVVNDMMSRKLLVYEIAGLDNPQGLMPKQVIKMVNTCDNSYLLKDGKIVYIPATLDSQNRIEIVDTLNNKCSSYAPYPILDKEQNGKYGYEIFMPHFVVNNDESRMMIFSRNSDIIDIYTIKGELFCSKCGPDHFAPEYSIESENKSVMVKPIKGEARMAYFNAVSRGDKIWVMYNGSLRTQRIPSKYILTFSWDGEPLNCYVMNDGLVDFDIDVKCNTIYGLHKTTDGEHKVIAYKY